MEPADFSPRCGLAECLAAETHVFLPDTACRTSSAMGPLDSWHHTQSFESHFEKMHSVAVAEPADYVEARNSRGRPSHTFRQKCGMHQLKALTIVHVVHTRQQYFKEPAPGGPLPPLGIMLPGSLQRDVPSQRPKA